MSTMTCEEFMALVGNTNIYTMTRAERAVHIRNMMEHTSKCFTCSTYMQVGFATGLSDPTRSSLVFDGMKLYDEDSKDQEFMEVINNGSTR